MDRETQLGFKPQKELIYNNHLPYADQLDVESNEQLQEIKKNFSLAVQLRDVDAGAFRWSNKLHTYLHMYGFKFSKEDHVALIQLLYELVTIPDLDGALVLKFSALLAFLLKKTPLLTPDDLVLEWRPLYDLLNKVMYAPAEQSALVLYPTSLEKQLVFLLRVSRYYFPPSATQEILDELRPMLCPFDTESMKAFQYMEILLPTHYSEQLNYQGYKLWYSEVLEFWEVAQNSPPWEGNILNLFTRLAKDSPGCVDWEPFIPKFFTRFLRSFHLPVSTNKIQVQRHNENNYDVGNCALFIACMLGQGSSTQQHINKFFSAVESYFHPSNIGKYTGKLCKFLHRLCANVVTRVYRERYRRESWEVVIPASARLTDDDITVFVDSVKPVALLAMFGRYGSHDVVNAMRQLALLRPERVIPSLLDYMYPALESVMESHRLIACLNCVASVYKSMLGNSKWFPEGRLHVLPILNLCLPGLDLNDIRKCLCTFQLLSTFASLIPIVDCSTAPSVRSDLTDTERELCSHTAQFEDFVMQYLDRIMALIENSSQAINHGRESTVVELELSSEEAVMEVGILSSFIPIMQQCSKPIYQQAFSKLYRFATTNIFESQVAARYTAAVCRVACQESPVSALAQFVPHLTSNILQSNHSGDITKEEHLDKEMLWNLRLLSEVVRLNGAALVAHEKDLCAVLDVALEVKCPEGAALSAALLQHLLRSLTLVYALDYRSTTNDWNKSLDEHLPIRDWGLNGDLKNLKMQWHIPSEAEIQMATNLLQRYLLPQLKAIQLHIAGTDTMQREKLTQSLRILLQCVCGAGSVLPMWSDSPHVHIFKSQVDLKYFGFVTGSEDREIKLEGQNVRKLITDTVRPLLEFMLASSEDDTKSLLILIKVYYAVMLVYGVRKDNYDSRLKSLHVIKRSMQNKFIGKKRHIRAVLVDRIVMQHEHRLIFGNKTLTQRHVSMIEDLFLLATSQYSQVRKKAQNVLTRCQQVYPFSAKLLETKVAKYLQHANGDTQHHQLKGALYLLAGDNFVVSQWCRRSWDTALLLCPAFLQTYHSEKPSIVKLIETVLNKTDKNMSHTTLRTVIPQSCIEVAKKLYSVDISSDRLDGAMQAATHRYEHNRQTYYKLVNTLTEILESNTLTWKFYDIAVWFLSYFARRDIALPVSTVTLAVKGIVHESVTVRKRCITLLTQMLKQQKRAHTKRVVHIPGAASPAAPAAPGDRPDNEMLQYHKDTVPATREQWDETAFVEKTYYGYYCWPKEMRVYSPSSDQPPLGRDPSELSPEERVIYDHFINKEFVDTMFSLYTLETNKGNEKFDTARFHMFRGLFRNYDDAFMSLFVPHIQDLVNDTKPESHESSQCFAAELIASIICGAKHWSFDKLNGMWEWLVPVIRIALTNMSTETIANWGTCFATATEDRDPRRLSPLLEVLLDDPLLLRSGANGSSFSDMSRLYVLQGALGQHQWRVAELLHQLKDYLMPHLLHPYKNVRDRIGSVLVNVFLYDLPLNPNTHTKSPQRAPFLLSLLDHMTTLVPKNGNNKGLEKPPDQTMDRSAAGSDSPAAKGTATANAAAGAEADLGDVELMVIDGDTSPTAVPVSAAAGADGADSNEALKSAESGDGVKNTTNGEREDAIRMLKTVMRWLQGSFSRMHRGSIPELYQLMPIICTLESDQNDSDLPLECSITLACVSHSLISDDCIQPVLHCIQEVSQLSSWHARATILRLLQTIVFGNLFTLQLAHAVSTIRDVLLTRLCDVQIEVRELAAVTLSGLIHCAYIQPDDTLLETFEQLSSTRVRTGKTMRTQRKSKACALIDQLCESDAYTTADKLVRRHAGVLGYSACIQAHPYSVPDHVPDVLMRLSNHLDDPQPIPMTVKKTLSEFRRTHYDNWQDHRQKFTDDQLSVLTDLLVSPNYYA